MLKFPRQRPVVLAPAGWWSGFGRCRQCESIKPCLGCRFTRARYQSECLCGGHSLFQQLQLGNNGQMVRGHQGSAAAMKPEMPELKTMVEINVIEMQKGENPGIGAAGFQELLQIDALEVFAHQA